MTDQRRSLESLTPPIIHLSNNDTLKSKSSDSLTTPPTNPADEKELQRQKQAKNEESKSKSKLWRISGDSNLHQKISLHDKS
jgi:hypothetical protein